MRDPQEYEAMERCKEAIEARLKANLEAAREAFEKAKEEYRKTVELQSDPGAHSPDGRRAFLTTAAEQRRAIHRYSAALRALDDFVLRGIIPANLHDSK